VPSLSRHLANWVANLDYKDLPPEVVDRAKGLTLHGLSSALIGAGTKPGKDALALMKEEEAGGGGVATVLADGTQLTKGGAAFVNSELIYAGDK
jgi:2-methylcitrate dehydratase PrpD